MNDWDYSEFWNEAIRQLKKKLTDYELTWVASFTYQSSKKNTVICSVPSSFFRDQVISKGYKTRIEEKLEDLSGQKIEIEIEIKQKERKPRDAKNDTLLKGAVQSSEETDTSGFQEASATSASPSARAPKEKSRGQHPLLKSEYTFENFVVGDTNMFAENAARAVASNPGQAYNPLLLYGGVGLGKTHLMMSIGNEAWQKGGYKVVYVTAEDFVNEFIESTHSNTMPEFKNKYRKTDFLLIDDIQFFAKKMQGSQSELFYTFNALETAGKQIVFTCDRPVSELRDLEERIKSRCQKGLNVDLQPPEFETRCAILKKKLENYPTKVEVSDDVLSFIAENVSTNVRDLEGCLTKIIAYANIKKVKITKEIAESLLKDTFSPQINRNITAETIQKKVAEYFNVSLIDMKGKKRQQSILLPRQIAMYLCRSLTEMSLMEIGTEFGGRDHTTIINSLQKIEDRIKVEPSIEKSIKEITKILNAQ